LDAAPLLDALDLVGEARVAAVLELARDPAHAPRHAHATVRVAALDPRDLAPERTKLPVGGEGAVAEPAPEGGGEAVEHEAVAARFGRGEEAAQAHRESGRERLVGVEQHHPLALALREREAFLLEVARVGVDEDARAGGARERLGGVAAARVDDDDALVAEGERGEATL